MLAVPLVAATFWQLEYTDPSPLDPKLHGPHNHGGGGFHTRAECEKAGKKLVKELNQSKGFRPNASSRCYLMEGDLDALLGTNKR
jgi:hypothetical protein